MTKYILPIAAFALVISSCGTSNKYMADDIYVLKPSELAVGESSADETTYSAFKKRKQGNVSDRQMYAEQQSLLQYQQCLEMFSWRPNCGCTYTQWVNHSPYSYSAFFMRTRTLQPYFVSGFGMSMYHNGYGMSPHMAMYGTGQYGYHGMYGNPYLNNGFYGYGGMYNDYYGWGNMYGNGFGYGWGNMYGNGWGGYGYGGNSGGQSTASNVHRGPRGSGTGFANPGGRNYSGAGTVKSVKATSPTNGTGTTKPTRPLTTSTTGKVVTRPIAEIGKTSPPRGTATSTYDRGVTKQPTNSGSRDYTRPTNVNRGVNTSGTSPARNTGTTIRQTAPRGNTTVSPTRTVEPRTSSPTIERSSGNSSSGGSVGGSRSGGSTNSGGGGRRP